MRGFPSGAQGQGYSTISAGAPAAPTSLVATPDALGNAVDVFFTGPDARSISQLTQYSGTLFTSPGGVNTGITATTSRNATTGMVSSYLRFFGVTAGNYTVQVTATNANGTSSATTSSQFTVAAASDYVISGGAAGSTTVPQAAGWGAYGGSGANSYADTGRVFPGQTNSILVAAGGLILPYYQSIWCSAGVNGNLYLDPWLHVSFLIYGTSFAAEVNLSTRWCSQAFGVATTGGSNTFTDISQNFVTNGLVNGAGSTQWKGTGAAQNNGAGMSNTVNTITNTNGGGHTSANGDSYLESYGDQDFASASTNSQPVIGGISSYTTAQFDPVTGTQVSTLTSLQANLWNQVVIPISALNSASGVSGNYQEFWYHGAIQEFRLQNLNASQVNVTNWKLTVA